MIQKIKTIFYKSIRSIFSKTIYRRNFKTPEFYEFYFSLPENKYIIQVGGNDGIQNDPLRIYFKSKKNYNAVIYEPIQYYYNKLKQLYQNRDDILVMKQCVSNNHGKRKIYFIKPEACDSIKIDNQNNNWLHGLGSFDKKNVENAINLNSFRDENYLKDNIISELVDSFKLKDLIFPKSSVNLLVIDVQGFELDVLLTLSFNEKIDYIIYEDEDPYSQKSKKIRMLLKEHHYTLIGRLTWLDQIYKKIF